MEEKLNVISSSHRFDVKAVQQHKMQQFLYFDETFLPRRRENARESRTRDGKEEEETFCLLACCVYATTIHQWMEGAAQAGDSPGQAAGGKAGGETEIPSRPMNTAVKTTLALRSPSEHHALQPGWLAGCYRSILYEGGL